MTVLAGPVAPAPALGDLPPARRRTVADHRAWYLLPGLFALGLAAAVYPGRMSADTLATYQEISTGRFTDWYAPVYHAWLRALVVPRVAFGSLVVVQIIVATASVVALLRRSASARTASIAAVVLLVHPTILGWVIAISRDVWLGSCVLAAGALGAHAFGCPSRPWRTAMYLGMGYFTVSAIAIRQNGLLVVLPLLAWWAWQRLDARSRRRPRHARSRPRPLARAAVACALAGGVSATAFVAVQATTRLLDATDLSPEESLYQFDLAGMSVRENRLLLPAASFPAQDLDLLRSRFAEDTVAPLIWVPDPPVKLLGPENAAELGPLWRSAIVDDPLTYLDHRRDMTSALIGLVQRPACYPYHPGIDPNPFGFGPALPWADQRVTVFLSWFDTSPLHKTVVWIALAAVLAGAVALRRRPLPADALAVATAGAVNIATFSILAVVCDVRFSWLTTLSCLVAGTGAAVSLLRRSAPPQHLA